MPPPARACCAPGCRVGALWEVDLAHTEPRRTYVRVHARDDRRMLPTPMANPRRRPGAPAEPVFASPDIAVRPAWPIAAPPVFHTVISVGQRARLRPVDVPDRVPLAVPELCRRRHVDRRHERFGAVPPLRARAASRRVHRPDAVAARGRRDRRRRAARCPPAARPGVLGPGDGHLDARRPARRVPGAVADHARLQRSGDRDRPDRDRAPAAHVGRRVDGVP